MIVHEGTRTYRIAQWTQQDVVPLHRLNKNTHDTMNKDIWKFIEILISILKFIINYYDTRTTQSQPTEHPEE